MNWQRIDENTYIDDTLVTCAEYQLFIDEMREGVNSDGWSDAMLVNIYGKYPEYYQPEHWASYQFLTGKAQEPILGVRYSDAIAFYEWLTMRDGGIWHYRLPTNAEAKEFALTSNQYALSIGYWINNSDKQSRLFFAGFASVKTFTLDHAIFQENTHSQAVEKISLNNERAIGFDTNNLYNIDRVNNALQNVIAMLKHHITSSGIDKILTYTRELIVALYNNRIDHDFVITHSIALDLECEYELMITLNNIVTHEITNAFKGITDRNRVDAIKIAINLYINLLTLQERIAGRSPAFEGIRLVKERIR